jgi:hypothetical protein
MTHFDPNPTIGGSKRHLNSLAIFAASILLCLALTGCSQSDEPTDSVDFVFPLEAGTTWDYRYSCSYRRYPTYYDIHGHQVWRSAGPTSPNSITILVTRIDTTTTYPWYVGQDTTTVITQSDTSFSITITIDSLYIQWYRLAMHGFQNDVQDLFKIPRIVESNTDTITRLWKFSQVSSYKRAIYVSGKGLTSWEDYNSSNYFWDERLILESMSP